MSTEGLKESTSAIPECYLGLVHTLVKPPRPSKQPLNTTSTLEPGEGGSSGGQNLSNIYYAFGIAPVLFFSIVIANSLLIWELCIVKRKNKGSSSRIQKISITKRLFIYHALTDLIIGSLVIPIQMTAHFQQGHIGYMCWYLSLAVSLTVFSQCTGINTLLTISFLRYLSIKKPFMVIKEGYVFLVLSLQTLLSLGVAIYTFFVYFQKSTAHQIGVNFFVLFIFISISSFLLVLWNVKSFMLLKIQDKHLATAKSNNGSKDQNQIKSTTTPNPSGVSQKDKQQTKTAEVVLYHHKIIKTSDIGSQDKTKISENSCKNTAKDKPIKSSSTTTTTVTTKTNYKARAVTTLITITISYVVCTIPYAVYSCILGTYLFSSGASLHEYFVYLERFVYIQALYLMNCALTPSIYVYRHRQQRLISGTKSKIIPSKKNKNDTSTSTQTSSLGCESP